MPGCAPADVPADVAASENIRRQTVETMQCEWLQGMQRQIDALPPSSTISSRDLEALSVSYAPMLDVDDLTSPTESYSHRFFMPIDWPQDWLEYESWSISYNWVYMDDMDMYSTSNLQRQVQRSKWFDSRLRQLSGLAPDIWDCYTWHLGIAEAIGLHLPCRDYQGMHRPNEPQNYEYYSRWAFFANYKTDRPHTSCMMLDSSPTVTDGIPLRSEVEAAISLIRHQILDGSFTSHHTKPVLVTTMLRGQAARITQAHVDSQRNRLVLSQSRQFDLSGHKPGADSWLLLRWLGCSPVGQTKYPDAAAVPEALGDDKASLPPAIMVENSA